MIVARRRFGLLWLPRSLPGYERRRCREVLRPAIPATTAAMPAVTYLCHAGLANRLRVHLVAHAYALRHGRALHVHWPANEHFSAAFTDLFEPLPAATLARGALAFLARGDALKPLPDIPVVVLRQDWQYIGPEELDAQTAGFAASLRDALIPRPAVRLEVDRFAATVMWPAVGLHIRLGDFKDNGQALPIERFIAAVKAEDQRSRTQVPLMLASDGSAAELAPLYAAFPGRIHRRRGSSVRHGQDAVTDALVDLLLLARCRYVIQTPHSSFGQIACFLGGCPGEPA
jgi:hypothetical protein